MDSAGTTTFGYDALNRLTSAAYPAGYGSWTWQYDAVGNRLAQTAPSGSTNYSYDANNRLTSAGGVNYTYDANGNLTSTTSGQSFAWDVFNRMTSATGAGGTATYTYNGDGLKIRRIGPDGTTRYYYDGIRPIWEADGGGSFKAQLDRDIFGNLLSRKEPAGTRRYYHFDGLGSTTALSDEGGTAVATMLYDAWGNQRAATGAAVPNYRFTGAELDTASGLYHMGARFYDPAIGRWLSEDPIQDRYFIPASLNFYSYAAASPTGLIDSTGSFPFLPWMGWWGSFIHNLVVGVWWVTESGYPGAAVNVDVPGGRLDMMFTNSNGVIEVYELKPFSHVGNAKALVQDRAQITRYVEALRSQGRRAERGTSFQPNGNIRISMGVYDIVLFSSSNPLDAGLVFYQIQISATGEVVTLPTFVVGILVFLAWLRMLNQPVPATP